MSGPSSTSPALWHHAEALVERALTTSSRDEFLDDTLDHLIALLGADRGLLVLEQPDGAQVIVNARAEGRALSARERQEVSRTLLREVLDSGKPLRWIAPADDATDGAPPASTLRLGIFAALLAPLRADDFRGAIYLDYRDPDAAVTHDQLRLLAHAANVVSIVFERTHRLEAVQARLRTARLRSSSPAAPSLAELTAAPAMATVRRELELATLSDRPLLVLGESGTGKTLLAHAIAHATGQAPVVRAALGSADDLNTITSELFGHERGAYSGASLARTGLVEYAHGGVLVLDEICNLPLVAQQLLLDFTQFGTYRPLGWPKAEPKRAQVRLIAVTNEDLDAAVASGRFRADLYYRLAANVVTLPPLRARRAEIPTLALAIVKRLDPDATWTLAPEVPALLAASTLEWRGNLRQLEALMVRARLRALVRDASATAITAADLDPTMLGTAVVPAPSAAVDLAAAWMRLQQVRGDVGAREQELIDQALAKHDGNVSRAALELGVARTSLASRTAARKR